MSAALNDVLIFFGVLVGTMFLLLGYDTVRIVHGVLSPGQAGEFTASERLLTEGRVLVSNLGLLLFPVPSRLSLVMNCPLSVSIVIAFAHRNHLPSVFLSMPAAGWLPGPAD